VYILRQVLVHICDTPPQVSPLSILCHLNPYDKVYSTGVKLTAEAMEKVESHIHRLPNLKKWFVEIFAKSA
ncbi:MAG: hypothetical protein V7L12_32955, partial [Nostoc sp.]